MVCGLSKYGVALSGTSAESYQSGGRRHTTHLTGHCWWSVVVGDLSPKKSAGARLENPEIDVAFDLID